jgi:hypothetical protein
MPQASATYAHVLIVAILVALVIVLHAWKWPRVAEVTPVPPLRQTQEMARR